MAMEPQVFSADKIRLGRGFSYQELKNANMDVRMAKKLGIRIDPRRRTAHKENIGLLKKELETEKKRREKEVKKKTKKGKGKKKAVGKKPAKSPQKSSGTSKGKAKSKGTTKKKSTSKK